jgi:5-methylcytosine-specific restriction endonuclease McrA
VFNGVFDLRDAWLQEVGGRAVCRFRLTLREREPPLTQNSVMRDLEHTRLIPPSVKQAVWKRDGGRCRLCGATDNLHFDHIIPYSKGGSSLVADNIQLLCARHNLAKHDRIE